MKRTIVCLMSMLLLLSTASHAQKKVAAKNMNDKNMNLKQMTWSTKSNAAKELALEGAKHEMNAEFEQAYDKFMSAIKLDPNFTQPLTFLATMTTGETRKMYAKRAIESAVNKTEGEKLFSSLVDENKTQEERRDIWAKLHEMYPDGGMIGYFYVVTRATPDESFAAAQDYLQKFPDVPAMNNIMGYYYMNEKKDYDMAKKYFEKYIEMYPEGSNPYDSMGEFYAITGDAANSEKYYALSLEKYPFTNSSVAALKKFADDKKKNTAKKE